jgi:hypothetical protein
MIRVDVAVADLAQTRFGFSPMLETVCALRAIRDPGRHAVHAPWIRWAARRAAEHGLQTPLVHELVIAPRWFGEFLLPAPPSRGERLEEEIERLLATPRAWVRQVTLSRYGERHVLRTAPRRTLKAYAKELRAAYALLVEPHWPRIQALLEADVVVRTRALADGGAAALFGGLDPRVRWHEAGFTVDDGGGARVARVAEGGLIVQPSAFLWPDIWVKPASITQTVIRYPARGLGTLWTPDTRAAPEALVALLGAPRARLLALLASPATTSALAAQLGVTPSAVSQHLRVLRDAGLVSSETVGRTRIHALAPTGRALVG